jgi:hypothetical protein
VYASKYGTSNFNNREAYDRKRDVDDACTDDAACTDVDTT